MTQQDMIESAKRAKFKIEFMAMMLLADRKDEAAEAYEEALRELKQSIGDYQQERGLRPPFVRAARAPLGAGRRPTYIWRGPQVAGRRSIF